MNAVHSATPCPGFSVNNGHTEQILSKVWELCPAAIVVTDPSGCIEYVNPAFERINGYTTGEVIGKNPRILNAGTQAPEVYADLWETISSGRTWTGRMQNRRKDGSLYWECSTISPLCDAEGKIQHYVAVKENVTAEVESGEEARNARKETDLLAEQSGTVYWKLNAQGICTEVSRSCLKVWGYLPEEIVGRPFYELHPEAVREESILKASEIFERKEPFANFLHELVTRDGRLIWVITNGVPMLDEDGCLLGFSGTDTDVTVMKEAEDALRTAEEVARQKTALLKSIIESPAGMVIFSLDCDYRYTEFSLAHRETVRKIWGVEIEVGMNMLDIVGDPEDRAKAKRNFDHVLNGESLLLVEEYGDRSRSRLVYENRYSPILDVSGAVLGLTVFVIDITDRKNAEDALATESLRNRALLQAASDGIQVVDERGNVVEVNEEFCRMLGYTREEVLRLKIADWDAKWTAEELAAKLKVLISAHSDSPVTFETQHRRKDGTLFDVEINGVSVILDGNRYLYASARDITERKRAESELREMNLRLEEATVRAQDLTVKAEAASRAKSEFLAVMSHELRTPINGVLGFAELLEYELVEPEHRNYAKLIRHSGDRLLGVVNDILDFSSIEKGRVDLESATIATADLVESCCQAIRKTAADKGLDFRCECGPCLPEHIAGDFRRIRQILIKLLGNSVKFTSGGSVALRVATTMAEGRSFIDFSVTDSGVGIPQEILGRIFKPFTQADASLHRPFEGTGLGLAISGRLAETMGGSITVTSVPGKGSTFTLRLPLESPAFCSPSTIPPSPCAQIAQSIAQNGGLPHTGENASGGLVLVVEDDETNSLLAGKMLQSLGCRVEFAAHGGQAVEAFVPGKYLAILMDIRMPVMNGLEATEKIRKLKSGDSVPIIAITANVMPGDRDRCLDAGMDDFLAKPFKKEELAAKLVRWQ